MDVDESMRRGAFSGAGMQPALVGRERELEQLRQRLGALLDGDGGIVTLVGEAGIGKSRLIEEALATEEARRTTLLVGRSQSVSQTFSFHPFTDLLRGWAGIADGTDDATAVQRLEEALTAACNDQAREILPFIASLMGLRVEGAHAERLHGIEGEALERLIVMSMRQLFQRLAAAQPLVLFFEDVHWADRSSVQLLEMLLRLVTESRILFIFALRPEYADTGQRLLKVTRQQYPLQQRLIRLQPLAPGDCEQLARNLLDADNLPSAASSLIAGKAGGSPLFVLEMTRALVEQGAVEMHDERLRIRKPIDSIAVPDSVRDVIATRLACLESAPRDLLEVAAVIGRTFPGRVVAEILGGGAELAARLAPLLERDLLFERRTRRTAAHARVSFALEVEYVFQHALVQETIYDGIEPSRRRQLHARVAAAIGKVFADRLSDFHGMLAYHYLRAENLEKAEEYLFKAGEEAARAAASREALALFREASRIYLQLHGDGGDRDRKALLERNIGLALMNTGQLAEAMPHFDRALAYLGDPLPATSAAAMLQFAGDALAVGARLLLPSFLFPSTEGQTRYRDNIEVRYPRIKAQSTSDPRRLVFDYVRAVRLLNATDPQAVPAQVIGLYGGFAALFAYSGLSFGIGRRYLALADKLRRPGHAKDLFDHSCLVCICNYLEGKWADADNTVGDDAVRAALRYGGLWEVNTYLGLDADRLVRRGDFAGARRRIEQLTDLADTYGFEFARINSACETMMLLLEERRLEAALDAANLYAAAVTDDPLRVLALGSKAKAQVLRGDRDGASKTLQAAEEIVARTPIVPPWHLSAYAVARLHFDLEALQAAPADPEVAEKARRSARAAQGVAKKVAVQRGEIARLTARLHHLLGDDKAAERRLTEAIATCERLGAMPELARAHLDAAQWRLDLGDGRSEEAHRERAQELFVRLGLAWDAVESHRPAARRAA